MTTNEETNDDEKERPSLLDLITTYQQEPAKWNGLAYFAEARTNGRAGPALGNLPIEPVDTLHARIVATWGAPVFVLIRMRPAVGAGFGAAYFHEVSSRAVAQTSAPEPAPPAAPAAPIMVDESDRVKHLEAELTRLRLRMETPQSVAAVPTDPFSGAQRIFELTNAQANEIANRTRASSGPASIPEIIELAQKAAEKDGGMLAVIEKALPYIAGGVDKFLSMLGSALEARAQQQKWEREQWAAAYAARYQMAPPTQQTTTTPAPAPAHAVFAGHGVPTGESSQVPETPSKPQPVATANGKPQDVVVEMLPPKEGAA